MDFEHVLKLLDLYGLKYRIEPNLVRAVIYVESAGEPYARSRKGAQGLMQPILVRPVAKDRRWRSSSTFGSAPTSGGSAKRFATWPSAESTPRA